MIPLTVVLVVLAIGLLIFGWRGRIVDRGVYCRRCRFDLDGIDRAKPDACCPECGSDITKPTSTRPTLRRKRWWTLVSGGLLMLAGVVLTGVLLTNNTARIMAVLPDRVVLSMHRMGFDSAFTEIATNRLVRLNNPLSDETWDDMVDDAIAHQQDTNTAWDPRHGEVLVNAFIDGRLSEESTTLYVRHAIETSAEFPDTVLHGTDVAGVYVFHANSDRVSSLNRYGSITSAGEQITIWMSVTAAGVEEPSHVTELSNQSGGMFTVPGPLGRSMGGHEIRVPLGDLDWSAIEPDTDLTLFVEYEIVVKTSPSNSEITRWKQTDRGNVRVLPADAELVKLNTDPEIIESFRNKAHARVGEFYIMPATQRNAYANVIIPAQSDLLTSELPVALAGDLYVIDGEQEVRICGIKVPASMGISARMFSWRVETEEGVDEELLQRWLDAGTVTIEYRPNPSIAQDSHNIREILGVPLRFNDVNVTGTQPIRGGVSDIPADHETVGRPIED
ncbi:MAG: hypothetical protein JJ916_06485 [Phycisphaerales bacterium]|nr:hypothetical protein [Phycisphaerales bacterium]